MPFKSKSQMRWMWANEPEMAQRWSSHTSDTKDLPEKVDESLNESIPSDDPDLDPDEREELESQLGGYEIDAGDDDAEVPEGELVAVSGDESFDDFLAGAVEEPIPEAPAEDDQPEEPSVSTAAPEFPSASPEVPSQRVPANRPKEYSRRNKERAEIDPELYDMRFAETRDDLGEFQDEIDELHDSGMPIGRIAATLNDKHKLKTRPGPIRKKSTPGARKHDQFRCPECKKGIERTKSSWSCPSCNWKQKRALTPSDIADYLKLVGKMTRGAGSKRQDLGSQLEHNHGLGENDVVRDDCPACNWSTGFDSEAGDSKRDDQVRDNLRELGQRNGTFTMSDALQSVAGMDLWKQDVVTPHFPPCVECGSTRRLKKDDDIVCRECGHQTDPSDLENLQVGLFLKKNSFSMSKLPKMFGGSLYKYVYWILKNDPHFEPVSEGERSTNRPYKDFDWIRKMSSTRPMEVEWRYIDDIREGTQMSKTCSSCEEGNHHRCRDEWCDCCGKKDLQEMFGESMVRPPGSKPFQDWSKLGQFGQELKRQADTLKGNTYQTQDGQLMFYKDQMQSGEQPMVADMTQGIWSPMGQQQTSPHPNQQTNSPAMGSVFASKGN